MKDRLSLWKRESTLDFSLPVNYENIMSDALIIFLKLIVMTHLKLLKRLKLSSFITEKLELEAPYRYP